MTDSGNGNRTHEPSLRELTSDLDGLRDLVFAKIDAINQVLDERDRLYKERDEARRTAVDAALAAVKEQTKASFEASEKAIVKAEEAQKAYNQAHNDISRKMDDQNKATMPRVETENRFHTVEEKLHEIRTAQAAGMGQSQGGKSAKDEGRANVAMAVSGIGLLLGVLAAVYAWTR